VSYPGVYIQEVPSAVHSIVGVSTSATAFVDVFKRGPTGQPVRINSLADFARTFGGVWPLSEASYAIAQYFLNGGETAWVVRLDPGDTDWAKPQPKTTKGALGTGPLSIQAANKGTWGNNLQVAVQPTGAKTLNVAVRELQELPNGKKRIHDSESYDNLTTDGSSPRYVKAVINSQSSLISITQVDAAALVPPSADSDDSGTPQRITSAAVMNDLQLVNHPDAAPADDDLRERFVDFGKGVDGPDKLDDFRAAVGRGLIGDEETPSGLYALRLMDPETFNLLCLPATVKLSEEAKAAVDTAAAKFCADHRAFYLVDCPIDSESATTPVLNPEQQFEDSYLTELGPNAAVYFPAVTIPDPLNGNRPRPVGPSGTIAGVMARTDTARGIWKAAAGTNATLRGATPAVGVGDADNGALNELGINVLRTFPIYGSVAWGARTLDGADVKESQWKYVSVRRLALYIENSLFAGTKWAVFEPNDEPLWGQLRLSVGSFMHDLFRQGAFAGASPSESYYVRCDRTTTTESDIDNGIVNIVVGFAPLKPAEFVILSIQQIAPS